VALSLLESESVRGVVPRAARDGTEAPVLLHGLQQGVVAVRGVVGGGARHSGADEGGVNLRSACSFSNQNLKRASAISSGCRWFICKVACYGRADEGGINMPTSCKISRSGCEGI
jgi:hypothetical protein